MSYSATVEGWRGDLFEGEPRKLFSSVSKRISRLSATPKRQGYAKIERKRKGGRASKQLVTEKPRGIRMAMDPMQQRRRFN